MGKTNHTPGKLAAVALKHLKDGIHADGGNLYLLVRGASKSWVFRFTSPEGGRRQMGLGPLHAVPLAEARKRAAELREQLKHPTAPLDPLTSRQEARMAQRLGQRRTKTFRECATTYIDAHQSEWKNPKHAQQWTNTLAQYAYPVFGDIPVGEIDEALILNVLTPIWNTKTETAKRLRGRIESVLDWATFNKYRQGENPARWKGHLEHSLAKPSKVAKVTHHPAMPYQELPGFMKELRERCGMGAKALELLILTACRSGEIRGAVWSEIDLGSKLWVIPAQRMKMAQEHRVPLSEVAVDLLTSLPRLDGTGLVFPSSKPNTPLSDMTLTAVLRRCGGDAFTVHGFRSCFRDWLNSPFMESHISKYRKLVPALALLDHLIVGSTGDIGVDSLKRAIAWKKFLLSHAERAYAAVTAGSKDAAKALAKHIKQGDLQDGFTVRNVYRKNWSLLATVKEATEATEVLQDMGWLRAVRDDKVSANDGRPTVRFLVNPKVATGG